MDELSSIVAVKVAPLIVIFICWLLLSLLLLVGCSVAELVGSKSVGCLSLDGVTKTASVLKLLSQLLKQLPAYVYRLFCLFPQNHTYFYFRLFEWLQVIMADCVIVEIVCSLTGVII